MDEFIVSKQNSKSTYKPPEIILALGNKGWPKGKDNKIRERKGMAETAAWLPIVFLSKNRKFSWVHS